MDFLLNDLSIEGQFSDALSFCAALERILEMRNVAHKAEIALYCRQNISQILINPSTSVRKAIEAGFKFTPAKISVFKRWIDQQGPFWDDARKHHPDDWLRSGDEIVTDTAVGEAAYCSTLGLDRRLVSLAPSQWERSPVTVTMLLDDGATNIPIPVANYWTPADLETALQAAEPPIDDWPPLETVCRAKFQLLRFSAECFEDLYGYPFARAASDGILRRLAILDRLMGAVDDVGRRTAEGDLLLQEHFTGERAWFSNSSATEKREFDLTFPHPDKPGETLFCPYHGKVNNRPPLRIHFSWPVSAGEPLYVVHVGEKLTKK